MIVGIATALLVWTGASGCTGSGGSSQGKAAVSLGPIRFEVKQDGSIDVAVGAKVATSRGSFGVGMGVEYARDNKTDKFLVVIRRPVGAETKEDIYEIDSEHRLRVTSDGRVEDEISPNSVLITVDPGATITVEQIPDAADTAARPTGLPQPAPEFTGTWAGRVAVTANAGGKTPGYAVKLTVRPDSPTREVGTVELVELRCSATLTVPTGVGALRADRIILRQDVVSDPDDACVRQSWVILTALPDGKLKYTDTETDIQPPLTGNDREPSGTVALLSRT